MTIEMWRKAQGLIAADARDAWRQANEGRKRHRPYRLPARADDLVKALGSGDAETVAAIMLYRYGGGGTK